MARLSPFAFPSAALLFVAVPGHSAAWFSGLPIGFWTLALVAVLAFAWAGRRVEQPRLTGATLMIGILLIVKVAVAAVAPAPGWLGRYYANGEFAGAPRRSTEFARLTGATRIDPAIDFHDDYLPLYFLNETDFNRGIRREVTEPISVHWTGHVQPDRPIALHLSVETRGSVRLAIDGVPALEAATGAGVNRDVTLPPGDHVFDVRYRKPADTDPLVRVTGIDAAAVTPAGAPHWRLAAAGASRVAARTVDVLAVLVFGYALYVLAATVTWPPARIAAAAMLALFIIQGILAAAPLQRRAVSLSGGDDWLGFEARGRAVATGDVLQLYGQPMGKGDVFYYYPGYSYFLAAVHAVGSEDFSAPVFVHFLLLFGANVVVFRLASRIFDRRTAIASLVFLVAIEELAFIRHYTVTLLSENLYFFTSAVTIDQLVRYATNGRSRHLAWAGLAGGVSSMIRPAMMIYLGPAIVVTAAVALRLRRGIPGAAAAALILAAAWIFAVLPATARNYVAAGEPVLISTSPTASFINYNTPPNVDQRFYRELYLSGRFSAPAVLARIVIEHPVDSVRGAAVKLGFSLGLLQLMGGYLHPELVAASFGYILALLLCPAARSMKTWPVHAFVLAHLAGMVLTMPSNYGYRLILPMYLFFPMFAVHFAIETWQRMTSRLNGGSLWAAASSRTSS